MKKQITLFILLCSLSAIGQKVQFAIGPSLSKLDWQFKYDYGQMERFYEDLHLGVAFDLHVHYLERKWFSVSSNLGYFQSGGEIAAHEVHENWIISETKNIANNISLGTHFNFIPLNNKLQVLLAVGPRLDYLIPAKNTSMHAQTELQQLHFGVTGSLGVFYNFEKFQIGIRTNYLHRITKLMETEPTITNNWWEIQKLGVHANDSYIQTYQFVFGFDL